MVTLVLSSACAPSPDQGAPYVFRIGFLLEWRMVGIGYSVFPVGPATATCTAYGTWNDNAAILATGCTFVLD
ncbi:hypothetical protein [Amycolatopsis sp.]|uniref:hypothetical protein n=1 Tax=Amycolatopsis sp. TaxID=37632 RepID=UPI002D800B22|nr:hypothetical protein [Amycolatopsis sp.]HET6710004.1 hypothetical protein [Amycolatopsis sp.]